MSAGQPDLQDVINNYWTERAPSYDAYQQRPERRALDRAAWGRVWGSVLPAAPADVLDVGTGSGQVACLLAGLGHRVTGIDLSEGMLSLATSHASRLASPPRFLRGDAVAPDFGPDCFDALVGRYVMWTMRDPATAVRNWLRLLRPGGVVAMVDSTWFPDGIGDLYPGHGPESVPLAEAASIEATAAALRDGGFSDVEIHELREIHDLDNEHGVAPGHQVQLQFLVTGRRR